MRQDGSAMSIVDLLPKPSGEVLEGPIMFAGKELKGAEPETMYDVRGNEIGVIFQEPMAALNPVHRISKQIIEALQLHREMSANDALKKAVELLEAVGIPAPEKRVTGIKAHAMHDGAGPFQFACQLGKKRTMRALKHQEPACSVGRFVVVCLYHRCVIAFFKGP